MEWKKIFCKGCRNGCPLDVQIENNIVIQVDGNCCHRGIVSAKKQLETVKEQNKS